MLAVGTDLALVWAVLAFIMNFVPNVGIILSVVPPAILTLLELGWQRALVVLAGFLVLNFVVDNLVKPRFMQSGLDVPPLVGLLSLVIWAYLLGPTGRSWRCRSPSRSAGCSRTRTWSCRASAAGRPSRSCCGGAASPVDPVCRGTGHPPDWPVWVPGRSDPQ